MDRGRAGTKRHQAVDKNGLPLATMLSGANVPDGQKLLAVVDTIPFVRGKRGRPRHRPDKVHADKAYDDKKLRRGLRRRGIEPRIARRGVESTEKLGRFRWVAERTFSWQQNARLAGSRTHGVCGFATNGVMTFMKGSQRSRTRLSAGDDSMNIFVRTSKENWGRCWNCLDWKSRASEVRLSPQPSLHLRGHRK